MLAVNTSGSILCLGQYTDKLRGMKHETMRREFKYCQERNSKENTKLTLHWEKEGENQAGPYQEITEYNDYCQLIIVGSI